MKFLCFELVNVNKRIKEAYNAGGKEAAYAAYRAITGADVRESWRYCKPLIREWKGSQHG